jgi:hypothetical protein
MAALNKADNLQYLISSTVDGISSTPGKSCQLNRSMQHIQCTDSRMLPRKNCLFGCTRSKPSQGSVPAGLARASDFGSCLQYKVASSLVLLRPIETTALDMGRPVNYRQWFFFLSSWGGSPGCGPGCFTTVDHSDIRGSMPHNRDPSGGASDNLRGLVHRPSAQRGRGFSFPWAPRPQPALPPCVLLSRKHLAYAAWPNAFLCSTSTFTPMAQMNPNGSRPTAVITFPVFLPRAASFR